MPSIIINGGGAPEAPQSRRLTILLATIALASILILSSVLLESSTLINLTGSQSSEKSPSFSRQKAANNICREVCPERRNSSKDLSDSGNLLRRLEAAKGNLLAKLQKDYGDYFEAIFVDPATGAYRPVRPLWEVSRERLRRKLQIKILSMQARFRRAEKDFHGCDCSADRAEKPNVVLESFAGENATLTNGKEYYETYVWASGGDSVMAGHGNLFNESVTAYLERDLAPVFESIGIDFLARNHAMGGTGSATRVSMCFKEIFGDDVDFFVWNYNMVDHRSFQRILHYAYRGAALSTRPGMLMLDYKGRFQNQRLGVLRDLEAMGLAAFVGGAELDQAMKEAYPDSGLGAFTPNPDAELNNAKRKAPNPDAELDKAIREAGFGAKLDKAMREKGIGASNPNPIREAYKDSGLGAANYSAVEALPELVKHYRCGNRFESGEPFCDEKRFSQWVCWPRIGAVKWHPGYKHHARVGHGIALFFVETLLGALRDLLRHPTSTSNVTTTPEDPDELLARLLREDTDLHRNFTAAQLPPYHKDLFDLDAIGIRDATNSNNNSVIDDAFFFRGPSMCHTALLPSQSRYLGLLTETSQVGKPSRLGEETYYVGHNFDDAKNTTLNAGNNKTTNTTEMRLVYNTDHERQEECADTIFHVDYKDFWFTDFRDGWTRLVFPNKAERNYYNYDPSDYEGIIMIHWRNCERAKCPESEFLTYKDYANQTFEMRVNTQRVAELIRLETNPDVQHAIILKGEDTGFRFEPDADGQYTIEIKVNREGSYVAIADFVLY